MTADPITAAAPVRPPRLRPARFADHPAIHRLESVFFPDSLPDGDRRRLFTDSPLWPRLGDGWPVGWVLEDADGRIVGSLNNVPSAYRLDGEERLCANGHCWVALPAYRGYAAMLMDEYFTQERPDLVLSAKVGADATAVWGAYARRVPVGDWSRAAYAITRYRDFARTALRIKRVPLAAAGAPVLAGALRVRDAVAARSLPPDPPSYTFSAIAGFDDRFDAFWRELLARQPGRLLGVRDAATLRWHYGVPLRDGRIRVVTAVRDGLLRAYCVLKRHVRPTGVHSVKLVDVQSVDPGVDLLPGMLRVALRWAAADGAAVLEHHGCGLPRTRAFDAVAPYRATKPAWSFYYRAADRELDARLADPDVWDPSEYDGDSSYK